MSEEQANQSPDYTQVVIPSQLLLSGLLTEEANINPETGLFRADYETTCQNIYKELKGLLEVTPFSFESSICRDHVMVLPFPQEVKSCFGEEDGTPVIIVVRNIGFNEVAYNESLPEGTAQSEDETEYPPVSRAQNQITLLASRLNGEIGFDGFVQGSIRVGISPVLGGTDNNHIAGGGPGGLPVDPNVNCMKEIQFQDLPESGEEPKVSIAVLDTAYNFSAQRPKKSLCIDNNFKYEDFEPTGTWMNDAFPNGIHGVPEIHMESYDLKMKDHGLFVSSLAKASAPKGTTVKLYQILDDYGVGTGESMCRTFHRLAWDIRNGKDKDKRHWVVNMSFFAVLTGSEHEAFTNLKPKLADPNPEVNENKITEVEYLRNLTDIMQLLTCALQSLEANNRRIIFVAAAGNTSSPTFALLDRLLEVIANIEITAFAPARYKEVISVAATWDKAAECKTTYSRPAKDPQSERKYGVQTFGGDVIRGKGDTLLDIGKKYSTSQTNGIIGLYYNKYPLVDNGTKSDKSVNNDKGLAAWAGTSFATPLVSGAFAHLLSLGLIKGDDPTLELYKVLTDDQTAKRGSDSADLNKPVKLPLVDDQNTTTAS